MSTPHETQEVSSDTHTVEVQTRHGIEWKMLCYYHGGGTRKRFRFAIPMNNGWSRGKPKQKTLDTMETRLTHWGAGDLYDRVVSLIDRMVTSEKEVPS